MARFRDTQILNKITNPEYSMEHEAQLFLFLMVEQKIRVIIQEAQKYQHHFKKTILTRQEIELAIKDQNQSNTQIMGFNYMDTVTMNKKRDTFILNDQNCDLKDLICQEMRQITIPINFTSLQLHYVLKDGKMVNIPETQSILRLNDILTKEIKEDEEQQKQFAMVKDNIYQILSPHQQEYLKQFMKLFNQNIYQRCEEFQKLITQIKQYQDIAGILPFLIKFFYSFCDSSGVFAYKTKSTLLECIENLLLNRFVNLDFHLHIVIKMLLLLLTSQINSGSISKDSRFYSKVAQLLKMITKKYCSKYLLLDVNFAKTMYQILEEQLNEIQSDSTQSKYYNMLICNAIVEVHIIKQPKYFQDGADLQEIKYLNRMIQITSSILNSIQNKEEQQQQQNGQMDIENQYDFKVQQMEAKYIYCKLQLQLEISLIKLIKQLPYITETEQAWAILRDCQSLVNVNEFISLHRSHSNNLLPSELFIII